MARQVNSRKIGRKEDIVYYKLGNKYYSRSKSSLSKHTVLTDKVFENTRRSASQLAQASKLASTFYHQLPADQKSRKVFHHLVGQIKLQLKHENAVEDITTWFNQCYLGISLPLTPKHQPKPETFVPYKTRIVTAIPKFYIKRREPQRHKDTALCLRAFVVQFPTPFT